MGRVAKVLQVYKKTPELLTIFQQNIAFIMKNFKISQKELASLGGFDENTFGHFLRNMDDLRYLDPSTSNTIGDFSLISGYYQFDVKKLFNTHLTIADFYDFISSENDKLPDHLKELYKVGGNLRNKILLREPIPSYKRTEIHTDKMPLFSLNNKGVLSDWYQKNDYGFYVRDNFRIPVDFAVTFMGREMRNEEHIYNIWEGSTLGFNEIANYKLPIEGDIYLVATRNNLPMVKVLKKIDTEKETIELVNLNTKEFPEVFSYNFEDKPTFYELMAIMPPAIIVE